MTTLGGTLYLTRVVITEVVSDPNKVPRWIVAGSASGIGGGPGKQDSTALDGDFRSYGNGNVRFIAGSGRTRTQSLGLRALTPDQLDLVRDLQGQLLCYRDTYGRRVFGVYKDLTAQEIAFSGTFVANTLLTDVALVIQTVAYVESV